MYNLKKILYNLRTKIYNSLNKVFWMFKIISPLIKSLILKINIISVKILQYFLILSSLSKIKTDFEINFKIDFKVNVGLCILYFHKSYFYKFLIETKKNHAQFA